MSYKVEIETEEHEKLLGGVMAGWSRQDHDVHLVSEEGHKVFSHRMILSFYSSVLREILTDPMIALSQQPVTIFLPASVSTISSLIQMLVKGKLDKIQANECILTEDIKEIAREVGIELDNCSDGDKKSGSGPTVLQHPIIKTLSSQEAKKVPKPFKIVPKTLKIREGQHQRAINRTKSKNIDMKKGFLNEETIKTKNEIKPSPNIKRFGTSKYLTASGKFACDVCDKEFKRAKVLYKHRRCVHKIKRSMRQEQLPAETIVKEEKVEVHNEQKKYECDNCGKSSKSAKMLRRHKLTHLPESEKPYPCDICSKRFCQSQQRKNHKLRYHGGDGEPVNLEENSLADNGNFSDETDLGFTITGEMPTDEEIGYDD